jgi:hypothetical protein
MGVKECGKGVVLVLGALAAWEMKVQEETRRFRVVDDDGSEHVIVEYANSRIETTMWGSQKVYDNLRELRTTDGYHVSPLAEGTFEIVLPSGAVTARPKEGTAGNSAQ